MIITSYRIIQFGYAYPCSNSQGTTESPVTLPVRLVDGMDQFSGRIEVLYNDTWGTVCDDGWSLQDASIVCKQLLFGEARQAVSGAHFGEGSGPIWLDEVQCSPGAASLSNCLHNSLGATDCQHSEDAGVVCNPPGTASVLTGYSVVQVYFYIHLSACLLVYFSLPACLIVVLSSCL